MGDVDEFVKKTALSSTSPIFFYDDKGNKEELLSEIKLRFYTDKMVDALITEYNRKPDSLKGNMLLKNLLEAKKIWYPAVQKNVNTNIGIFDTHLKDWIAARSKLPNSSPEVITLEVATAEKEIENGC